MLQGDCHAGVKEEPHPRLVSRETEGAVGRRASGDTLSTHPTGVAVARGAGEAVNCDLRIRAEAKASPRRALGWGSPVE